MTEKDEVITDRDVDCLDPLKDAPITVIISLLRKDLMRGGNVGQASRSERKQRARSISF